MRFQLVSDVHMEFYNKIELGIDSLTVLSDTLVIAGDLTDYTTLKFVIRELAKRWKNVVYVPGNHEYYGSTRGKVNQALMSVNRPNFHRLWDSYVEIDGVRFIGNTLWFERRRHNWMYKNQLNDFTYIKDYERWVYDEHEKTVSYLKNNIQKGDVVISHHAPSEKSIHPNFIGSQINRFYFSNLESLILDTKPAAWCHGHIHWKNDYHVGETRIISNPLGYPGFENIMSNPNFIVEV